MTRLLPGGATGSSSTAPVWLAAVPIFSCCLLGFVPPLVIAAKARTRSAALWAAGFTVTYVVGFTIVALQPDDTDNVWSRLGATLLITTGIGAACYAAVVAPKLPWGAPPAGAPRHEHNAQAVAAVMAVRQQRAEARALAERDPQMARDLGIGRPDLPRHYNDGGLVDVNTAPAEVMARWLGLTQTQAAQIVDVRHQLGRFERADDLLHLVGLEPEAYDQASDRIILL